MRQHFPRQNMHKEVQLLMDYDLKQKIKQNSQTNGETAYPSIMKS